MTDGERVEGGGGWVGRKRKLINMALNAQNHTFRCSVGNGKYVDGHHLKQIGSADC